MSVNKVVLIGRLGAEPEHRTFSNGGSLCNLRLATSESWKDKQSGERKERTEWHQVTLNNRLGEIAQQYLHKGSQVYIEGRIQTRKWQDKSGQDRYSTEIIANVMTMLGGNSSSEPRSKPQPPAEAVDDGFGIPTPYLDEDGDGIPW